MALMADSGFRCSFIKLRYNCSFALHLLMAFDLKTTVQPNIERSTSDKKLNRLIDEIEQLKRELAAWENAKSDIQLYSRKRFMPVYAELHEVLFKQLEQLWNSLSRYEFSKADATQLDDKIYALAKILKSSKLLNQAQLEKVDELYAYYQQTAEYELNKKSKKKNDAAYSDLNGDFKEANEMDEAEDWENTEWEREDWNGEHYSQAREQAKFKRQQEKREQAEKLVEQSLKTVYLKIAASIHPDREPDETKKLEKTELFQRANEAYEQQDLFYLLKLQMQVESSQSSSQKGLSAEQVKFYKMALEAQCQKLQSQIDDLIDALVWSESAKITVQKSKGKLKIEDLYKQIDADTSALKQQVKVEKQRLGYMGKESGLGMLLEHGVL
jgi:chemotaxis protein histidine kinase CheA